MTYPREWWGCVLFSAFALFCFFPACENMNFVSSYLALWLTDPMLLRQVLWNASTVREGGNRTKMSLMGCMAVSAGFFCPHWDVTFLQGQISNLKSLYGSTPAIFLSAPAPRQIMTKKNAQVFKQSSPWMKIKNSFKETIPVKVSLHQDNPISSCWDLPALCLLYGLVLQTGKNKTKQKNPCPYTELYCISMEIVLFLFFGCSKRTKAFIQLWVLWVKYDPPAPPSGYILELKKSLR